MQLDVRQPDELRAGSLGKLCLLYTSFVVTAAFVVAVMLLF